MQPSFSRGSVTLVAMPASGEIFIARTDDEELLLVSPAGAGGPQRIDEETLGIAIAKHGFELIDERFAGWEALDAERQRRAGNGLPIPDVDARDFDAEDVKRVMRFAERWRAEGQTTRARRVVHRLLDAEALTTDHELRRRLTGFLQELDELPASVPAAPVKPRYRAARERLKLVS